MTNKETGYYIALAGLFYWWYTYEPSIQIDPSDAIINTQENEIDAPKGDLEAPPPPDPVPGGWTVPSIIDPGSTQISPPVPTVPNIFTDNLSTPGPGGSIPDLNTDINIIDYPTEPEDYGLEIGG